MADGGTGTNVSGQLGVCRSEPCSNGALVGRESRQNAVRDRTNLDPKVTAQGYQQTRSASSDPRPTCSPSEYFSLKTSHNNAVPMNNHSTGVAATALNGCFVNGSKTPATKTEDWHSYRNPADKITESNLRPGGISRRSGIPVSIHRRSLSSTRENTTDGRLEFSATAKSAGSERNCLSREQACYAAQDSQTPQYDRRTSLEHEASHLVYRTPQNKNSHSGRLSGDSRTSWRNMSLRGTSSTGGRAKPSVYSSRHTPPSAVAQTMSRQTVSSAQQTPVSVTQVPSRRTGQAAGVEHGRSQLPKHTSQSQPGSRSTSPSPKFDYVTHRHNVLESPVNRTSTPRQSSLRVPRIHSRDSSPGRTYQGVQQSVQKGCANVSTSANAPATPCNGGLLSLCQLQGGSAMEAAVQSRLAAAAAAADNDTFSETSSISSGSHRRSTINIHMALPEIISHLSSGSWSERRDGLNALRRSLKAQVQLSESEVRKLSEIFSRMFNDPSAKVTTVFLDTLPVFVTSHADDVPSDWVYVALSRLYARVSAEQFTSVLSRLSKVLSAIRESFDAAHQWSALSRIICECSKLSDAKVRLTFLDYISDLAMSLEPHELSNTQCVQQVIMRVVAWASEPKCARIRQTSRSIVIALFNVNTPELYNVLSALPKSIRDAGYKILQNHMSAVSQESQLTLLQPTNHVQHFHLSSVQNDADDEGQMSTEEFYASLRKTAADIEMLNNFD